MKKLQVNSTSTREVFFPDFPYHPTHKPKKRDYSEDQKRALENGRCPICDTDDNEVEGFMFGGSDNRNGGFLDCYHCKIRVAWIDNPFEAEEQRYDD